MDGIEITVKAPVATAASGGQNVIVEGFGAQTIDGELNRTLSVDLAAITVKSDGANWRTVSYVDENTESGDIIEEFLFETRRGFTTLEHFLGDAPGAAAEMTETGYVPVSTNSGSASSGGVAAQADEYGAGLLELPTTTGTEDGAAFRNDQGWFAQVAGQIAYAIRVEIDNPPAANEEYLFYAGIVSPESNQRRPDDGVYFFADESSTNWFIVHERATVVTSADTGVSVATSTYQTLQFIWDSVAGTVTAFIDGTQVAQITPAAIQPAVNCSSIVGVNSAAVATRNTATDIRVDYIGISAEYSTLR